MRPAVLAITVLILFRLSMAEFDFCDGEPRVVTRLHNCNRHQSKKALPRTLITVAIGISDNPYHALHDSLWAFSHYLSHCTSPSREMVTVVLDDTTENIKNISRCYATDIEEDSDFRPKWGACVAQLLAKKIGVKDENILGGTQRFDSEEEEEFSCFDKTVTLGVRPQGHRLEGIDVRVPDFRGLSWFGRDCSTKLEETGFAATSCDESKTTGSGILPLPEQLKADAFQKMKEAILSSLALPGRQSTKTKRPVHVLLYDRKDTTRRQWANAEDVYKILKKDKRIKVRYTQAMPASFYEQVAMYSWADILIAPHGAASANTLFMSRGVDIIEIWKWCMQNVAKWRFKGVNWTGWQAPLLRHNLQYVQCHELENPFNSADVLLNSSHGPPTDGFHKVRTEEVMSLFENAMIRQQLRVARRPRVDFRETRGGKHVMRVIDMIHSRRQYLLKMGVWGLGPFCVLLLACGLIGRRFGRRKTTPGVGSTS